MPQNVQFGQYIPVGSGGSIPSFRQFNTGALTIGDNTIALGITLSNYTYQLSDATNSYLVNAIYPDPANPTTQLIINVVDDVPAGLTLTIIGTP
jgi:hypothetical protein